VTLQMCKEYVMYVVYENLSSV